MQLTKRFEDALGYAFRLHARQFRKGTHIPYIAHLLSVTSLVLEAGGDEEQAIAALLHDSVEDQGGLETLEEIRLRYGERVAGIVLGCTDATQQPKPPWRERKESYLLHLEDASDDILLVSLADKLHNAGTILNDLQEDPSGVWSRFRGGKEGTLWYYRFLVQVFDNRYPSPMAGRLRQIVEQIEALADKGSP